MISPPATETAAPSVIPINRQHLRAVRLFAAENDIRYYLNGVLVHVLDDGAVRLVATNGHAIAITHSPLADLFAATPGKLIVPIDVVKMFASHKGDTDIKITSDDGKRYTIQCVGLSVNFEPIEGKFVDYARVLPPSISGEAAQFDPELMSRFSKASTVYGGKEFRTLHVEHNGGGGALVHLVNEEFIGVIMPWRTAIRTGVPGWIKPGAPVPQSDDSDADQEALPGVQTAEEIAAEVANDKPLNTVGNAEAPKRPSKRDAKKAAEAAFGE